MQFITLVSRSIQRFNVKVCNLKELRLTFDTIANVLHPTIDSIDRCDNYEYSPSYGIPNRMLEYAKDYFKKQESVYVTAIKGTFGKWRIRLNYHADDDVLAVPLNNLHKFLTDKYVSFDGYSFDSKIELDNYLKKFVAAELTAFLTKYNALDKFLSNFSNKKAEGYGARYGGSSIEFYSCARTFDNTSEVRTDAQLMLQDHPFRWSLSNEGYDFWSDLSVKWKYHIRDIFDGKTTPLTKKRK